MLASNKIILVLIFLFAKFEASFSAKI